MSLNGGQGWNQQHDLFAPKGPSQSAFGRPNDDLFLLPRSDMQLHPDSGRALDGPSVGSGGVDNIGGPGLDQGYSEGHGVYNEGHIVQLLVKLVELEDRARRPHKESWDRNWDMFNGRYECLEGKADWQSQKSLPKGFITEEQAAAKLVKLYTQSANPFTMEGHGNDEQQVWLDFGKHVMTVYLDSPQVNFERVFTLCIKNGLLAELMCCLVTMQLPDESDAGAKVPDSAFQSTIPDSPIQMFAPTVAATAPNKPAFRPKSFPKLLVINPYRVFRDSERSQEEYPAVDGQRHRLRCWEWSVGEFLAYGEENGWINLQAARYASGNAGYRLQWPDIQYREMYNRTQNTTVTYTAGMVFLTEHCGDLRDETGAYIYRNGWCIMANGIIVFGPVDNPFAHGKDPLVVSPMVLVPDSPYGKSLMGVAGDSIELWVEFVNMMVDFFQRSLLGMFEVDEAALDDDTDTGSFFPGKIWRRNQRAKPEFPTVRPIEVHRTDPGTLQFLQVVKAELDDGVGGASPNIPQQGAPGQTAMQFTGAQSSAGDMLNGMFKAIEGGFLEPTFYRLFMNVLQFLPQEEWDAWAQDYGSRLGGKGQEAMAKLVGMPSDQRVDQIGRNCRFNVRVYSAIADRQAEIEKFSYCIQTMAKTPAAPHINWKAVAKKNFELFGYNYAEFIVEQAIPMDPDQFSGLSLQEQFAHVQQLQAQAQANQQMQQSAGGQAGPPGANGSQNATGPPTAGVSNVGMNPGAAGGAQQKPTGGANP